MAKFQKFTLAPAVLCLLPQICAAEDKQPNILFILADDYGWKDAGFMGSDLYETRNIDKLAGKSMIFTQGYSACSVSSPSRASIMTGLYTTHHGVTNWIGEPSGEAWRKRGRFTRMLSADYKRELETEFTTIAEALKSRGYSTFMAGKWHLGTDVTPEMQGFDTAIGYESTGKKGGYFYPYNLKGLETGETGEELDERLGKETASFIESQVEKGKPFFAYLSFYAVHAQIQTRKELWEKYRNKINDLGLKGEEGFKVDRTLPVRQNQDNPVYAGLVEHMDNGVGIVLDKIQELGIEDNTIIIFTGDNGGVSSGDNYSTSNAPLRGGKGRQWEGGIRVPMIIHVPGMTSSRICDTPVCGIDYFPTVAEMAGIEDISSYGVDGVSLLPLLNGEKLDERPLFWHYPHYGNQGGEPSSIIRKGNWKLIYYHETGSEELYNLEVDLGEQENLISEYPEKAESMRAELDRWLKDTGARFPVEDPEYSEKAERQYRDRTNARLLKSLENKRIEMLSETWSPDETWWGSQPTID